MAQKLSSSEMEDLVRRFNKFFSVLDPDERRSSLLLGEPRGMCEAGRALFESFCQDPENRREFLRHYDQTRPGGCRQCLESFLRHLFLVTD